MVAPRYINVVGLLRETTYRLQTLQGHGDVELIVKVDGFTSSGTPIDASAYCYEGNDSNCHFSCYLWESINRK